MSGTVCSAMIHRTGSFWCPAWRILVDSNFSTVSADRFTQSVSHRARTAVGTCKVNQRSAIQIIWKCRRSCFTCVLDGLWQSRLTEHGSPSLFVTKGVNQRAANNDVCVQSKILSKIFLAWKRPIFWLQKLSSRNSARLGRQLFS